jgi:CRP-like cAMP-binding protein
MAEPLPKTAPVSQNKLLLAMRAADLALLKPGLQAVRLEKDEVLYEPGDEVRKVYFPLDPTLIAFRVVLEDGRAVETALVGCEGAICGVVSQGRLPAYSRAVVVHEGLALRIAVEQLEAAKLKSLSIRHLFARYSDCIMAQVFQAVACNATHTVGQRAAKWLVAAAERTSDNRIALTQEQFAVTLGVGRSYVSRVVAAFQEKALIRVVRGAIVVTDIEGLRGEACGCQDCVRRHFEEVLEGVYPDPLVVAS